MKKENDILLPSFIDFPLYAVTEGKEVVEEEQITSNAHTLLVCNKKAESGNLAVFLHNILQAAQLNVQEDILPIYVTTPEDIGFDRLRTNTPLKQVLLFGNSPKILGISTPIPLYQPTEVDGLSFLIADNLSAIEQDKSLKKSLWMALKALYKI